VKNNTHCAIRIIGLIHPTLCVIQEFTITGFKQVSKVSK